MKYYQLAEKQNWPDFQHWVINNIAKADEHKVCFVHLQGKKSNQIHVATDSHIIHQLISDSFELVEVGESPIIFFEDWKLFGNKRLFPMKVLY